MVARAPWVRAGLALPARCRRVPAGPPRGSLPNAPPLPLPSSPALPRRGDASAWGRSGAWARGGGPRRRGRSPRLRSVGRRDPARGVGASAAAARPPGACGERETREGRSGGPYRARGGRSRVPLLPPPSTGGRPLRRRPAGRRGVRAPTRLAPGMRETAGEERWRASAWASPGSLAPVPSSRSRSRSPSVRRARARALLSSFRPSGPRPQIRRGDPLNLSILVSGGKETNQDSLSNGE